MLYTVEQIKEKLSTNDNWLKRGILRISKNQTEFEFKNDQTMISNGVGFNSADAKFLTSIAKIISINENKELAEMLSPKQLYIARKKMLKYSGQLTKIANGKL